MSRLKRITWLNVPHLVIAHANEGRSLFTEQSDYCFYLDVLRQMTRDRLLKVYAFALLEKELRLVIEPNRLILPRIMQRLHARYSAYMNRKFQSIGHLFRGRFQSLIFDPHDLSDVVRGVHLWPVRQGILRRAELYPYSSHAAYMGMLQHNIDFVSTKLVLESFGNDIESSRRAFSRFVEQKALEADSYGVKIISPGVGSSQKNPSHFLHKATGSAHPAKKSSVKTLAQRTSLLLSISLENLQSPSRRQDLVMARRLLATAAVIGAQRSVSEVAQFLQRDKAQISRLVSQGMDLLENNEPFSLMFEALKARGAIQDFYSQ
ncbi:MAG: hypothetical protein KC505_00710 [Myxococcales bacterium]|nr:hypothetical protein [Myxococcales bacterium]USN51337.1 MAG: hypothetical protein H6731_02720 [Myxococcales bacterium]